MIEISNLDHNGRGIARLNDKVVFIENALPYEIVDIDIIAEKKKYINAKVKEYIKTSNDRVKVKCPYYNECGGCDIMHLSENKQLEFKEEKIKNIINKYVDNNIKINNIIKSNSFKNYRNKITFKVKNNKIGFYSKASNNLVEIDKCLLANNIINNAIKYLKKLDLKFIDEITLRTADNKLMIILSSKEKDIDLSTLYDIADSIYIKHGNEYHLVHGSKCIYESIENYKFSILPDAFFQINIDVCKKLYNHIKNIVGNGKNILDLYCGTGSIGIFINENNNILGIEINEQAILNARENKNINKLNNVDFILGDSGEKIRNLKFNPDIIIVDPPRSGLDNLTIKNILNFNSKKIIYVSCDPMTLARDLNILKEKYNIIEITPFDMFPNTKHCESITVLERR